MGEAAASQHEAVAVAQRATVERLAIANRQLLGANRELTDDLDRLREQTDDLRLATATAQVAAEEIETLNEELQSTNEELETMHEEAQATVEELNVANDELQARAAEMEEMAATHAAERARLATVLAGMGDAVVVVDRDGRVVLTNAAYDELVRMLGGALHPADGRGIPLPVASTPQARAARAEAFRGDFTTIAADGTRRWFEATGRPLHEDQVGAGVVVIRDITDRSVRRLHGEFLAWAGHELRTPLTALQGYLQMAGRRVGPDGDAKLRDYLDRAVVQIRRQSSLVEELLDATRLETGRLALQTEPLDLAELATHAVEVGQVLADGQLISLEADDGPITIDGDAGRLEQVLLNLLTNAIRHATGTDRIEVTVSRQGADAVVVITDFGPGIDPSELETIFERFIQGASTERPGRGGLGLGLYIAREIVQAHGGTITVESIAGAGATFTIRLPLVEDAPAPLTETELSA